MDSKLTRFPLAGGWLPTFIYIPEDSDAFVVRNICAECNLNVKKTKNNIEYVILIKKCDS